MSHTYYKELPIHEWLFKHFRDPLVFINQDEQVIRENEPAIHLLGKMEGESIHDYIQFDLLKEQKENHVLMKLKTGTNRSFQVRSIKLGNREDFLYALIFQPVSLAEQKREIEMVEKDWMTVRSEGMVMHEEGRIIDCDKTFAWMFGYEPSELINFDVFQLTSGENRNKLLDMLQHKYDPSIPLKGVKKDGSTVFLEIIAHPHAQDQLLRVAVVKDVTERVHNEKKIEFMSYYDEMTDLPNRMYFNEMLNEAIHQAKKTGEKLAVHFIDIDYFKQINDTLGYSFGDQLLKECASRLKHTNEADTFVARMGGDEFLVLQRDVASKAEAEEQAQVMIDTFKQPVSIEGYDLFTTISVGISLFPSHGTTADDLIKQADSAMYTVKESQRNKYMSYDSSMTEKFEAMLSVETELRKAIKQEQLEIHYQPQKSIITGKVVGMEALIRWQHPTKGFIPPSSFIPVAEKTGQIVEIGEWVMRKACFQNKQWQNDGFEPVIVGVNLSALQFHQKDLVQRVRKILDETGLHPSYLELEITESMAMTNEEYIIKTLNDLRQLGVHVSIDDFGTGYSSLKYLSRFPVSKLKIDKAFINENQKQNQAIVKSIIHMSHSLNLKVIAEGVETVEQLNFLREEQCDEIQGYYYSRPLPPEQLSDMFSRPYVH